MIKFEEGMNLDEVVRQAIGIASVCWDGVPEGVFRDDTANELAEALLERIREHVREQGPNLGLATTRSLLEEITTRIEVDYAMGGGGLDYTTFYGRPEGSLN